MKTTTVDRISRLALLLAQSAVLRDVARDSYESAIQTEHWKVFVNEFRDEPFMLVDCTQEDLQDRNMALTIFKSVYETGYAAIQASRVSLNEFPVLEPNNTLPPKPMGKLLTFRPKPGHHFK